LHVFTDYNIENTKAVDMLLGIKYVSIFNHAECVKEYKHLEDYKNDYFDIYINPYNLSIGYAVADSVLDFNYEETNDAFSAQNNILKKLTGINEDVYIEQKGEVLKEVQDVKLEDERYIETGDNPKLIYEFEAESEDNIYVYMVAKDNKKVRLFVNGEEQETYFLSYNNEMINLGKWKIGEKIRLELCLEADEIFIETIHICYENEEALLKHYNKLKVEEIDFEKINSRTFKGNINIKEEERFVMLTIPYEEGWKITVDGVETEYIEVLDSLIGIKLSNGNHDIVLKYTPPKIEIGLTLSILGIIMFLLALIIQKNLKEKVEKSKKEF